MPALPKRANREPVGPTARRAAGCTPQLVVGTFRVEGICGWKRVCQGILEPGAEGRDGDRRARIARAAVAEVERRRDDRRQRACVPGEHDFVEMLISASAKLCCPVGSEMRSAGQRQQGTIPHPRSRAGARRSPACLSMNDAEAAPTLLAPMAAWSWNRLLEALDVLDQRIEVIALLDLIKAPTDRAQHHSLLESLDSLGVRLEDRLAQVGVVYRHR